MDGESTKRSAVALDLEVLAVPNDGSMSDQPTNATIVGTNELYIIDPGDRAGVELIQAAVAKRADARVAAILLTHAHPDHVRSAPELRRVYQCPVLMNPKEEPIMRHFLSWSDIDGPLSGGMTLPIDGGQLATYDTPGHSPGHIAFYEPASRTLIAGDLVAGHGTVGIFPPHGKMSEYFTSLTQMQQLAIDTIIPGHGDLMTQPPDIFGRYIERRSTREREIFDLVAQGPTTIDTIVAELYQSVSPQFRFAAAATILAHLEKLQEEGRVVADEGDPFTVAWRSTTSK